MPFEQERKVWSVLLPLSTAASHQITVSLYHPTFCPAKLVHSGALATGDHRRDNDCLTTFTSRRNKGHSHTLDLTPNYHSLHPSLSSHCLQFTMNSPWSPWSKLILFTFVSKLLLSSSYYPIYSLS